MVAPPVTDKKKEDTDKTAPLQEELQPIKHVLRAINAAGQYGQDGSLPLADVEAYLAGFFADGYKLQLVQHLRSNMSPEGNAVLSEQMLYVFVLE